MRVHYTWPCPLCDAILTSKRKLAQHKKDIHCDLMIGNKQKQCHKLASRPCSYCSQVFKFQFSLTNHEKYCKLNPNRIDAPSHAVSAETRKKISVAQHKAALEGRNKGWTTTKSGPQHKSYPERFFTKIIDNEFDDKKYVYNMPFYTWKLDFAWPHKKLCIEIDGSQHERDPILHDSDMRKDAKLAECGWQVLRLRWVDLFHMTQCYIQQAKQFVDNGIVLHCEQYISDHGSIKKPRGYSNDVWESRKNAILNSGIDLMRFGWVTKIEKQLGYTKRMVYSTVNKFKHEFAGKCYRRKHNLQKISEICCQTM